MTESKTFLKFKREKKRLTREKTAAIAIVILTLAVLLWSEGWAGDIYQAGKSNEAEATTKNFDFKVNLIKSEAPEIKAGEEILNYIPTEEEMVIAEIKKQAAEYAVNQDEAIKIADCESDFRMRVKNPNSSAKGVFQFLDGTWEWINAPGHQFDYKENIKQFMIWYPKYPQWWSECLN